MAGRLDAPADGEIALVNHSGLSDDSRLSPRRMAALLSAERDGPLPDLLPEHALAEDAAAGASARAKTGTMDFVRGLAGYLDAPSGRRLAFAYFANDLEARAATPEIDGRRAGARAWRNRAVALERALLAEWSRRFD